MHSYYKEKKDIKKGRYLCRTLYIGDQSDTNSLLLGSSFSFVTDREYKNTP